MEDLIAGIFQSSFSIAVAAFLLVRTESRLVELSCAITRLEAVIDAVFRREGFRPGPPSP